MTDHEHTYGKQSTYQTAYCHRCGHKREAKQTEVTYIHSVEEFEEIQRNAEPLHPDEIMQRVINFNLKVNPLPPGVARVPPEADA